jgi:5-formyltetrahydrofolate cyclo-ligase
MNPSIQDAKAALRAQVSERLKGIAAEDRVAASAQAHALLAGQPVWKAARSVLLFAPLPGELDLWPLLAEALAAGKRVALPRFDRESRSYSARWIEHPETEVRAGYFGIREPKAQCPRLSSTGVELILVPGVAFDLQGGRLGRGKGYYDHLLAVTNGKRCGVAFDEQVVPEVPVDAHDERMDWLLTPTRWRELPAR